MEPTFGERVIKFYQELSVPQNLPHGVEAIQPHASPEVMTYTTKFVEKYFSDNNQRVLVLGVNHGRIGSGTTGVSFTDPIALSNYCHIRNDLPMKRELSSRFIYEFINNWCGVREFYSKCFLSAVCPVGFLRNGRNFNYYDDKIFASALENYIVEAMQRQLNLGFADSIIVLGTGRNFSYFEKLNEKYRFGRELVPLEHPRYIMQYKRKDASKYILKYVSAFNRAVSQIA